MELQTTEQVRLRKISSLEASPLYVSMDEKLGSLRESTPTNRLAFPIPTYPPTRPYKNNTLRSMYSRIRYFSSILYQRYSAQEYPLICVVVVNNHCNWNCSYCFGDYPSRREIDYTTNELKYLIEQLRSLGARYVNLHGGETLLRKDIGELVSFSKNLGMYVCVITNGSLLEQKLEEVRNVDNLTISLDGNRENNDKVRGQGAFDAALSAIRLATKEKIPLRVQATLTRYTMNDVGFLASLAQSEGFHLQFSILFKPLKQARDAQMSVEQIKESILQIRKYKQLGYPVFTSEPVIEAAYQWPFDYNDTHHVTEQQIPDSYRQHHIKCYYSRTKFTIEADGYIYPCFLTTDGSFSPKNWKEVGVARAIEHVRLRNTCRACPAMTQNDHNALLGLNFRQVKYLIYDQLKEVFHIKNRPLELLVPPPYSRAPMPA